MTTEDVLIDELVQRVISSGVERLVSERTAGGSVVEKTAVVWPGCEEFTVEKGQQTIEKTVQVCKILSLCTIPSVCVCVSGMATE